MKEIDKIIVENLRRLMKELGLTQVELARRSKKSAEHFNKVLAGARRPGDELLEAMAPHLGVQSWQLYQRSSKRPTAVSNPEIIEAVTKSVRAEFAARSGLENVPSSILEALRVSDGRNWDAIEHLLKPNDKPRHDNKRKKLKSSS